MTPPRKAPDSVSNVSGRKKGRRPTISSLSQDLAAARNERDAITLQLETARLILADIGKLDPAGTAETNTLGLSQAVKLAGDAAQSIDVSGLLGEIRSTARLEAGVDTARLNALDSLVGDGGVGFGWQQIRGTYLQFYRIKPAERTRVGFSSPPDAVRTLVG
jgi:hypothetical protein